MNYCERSLTFLLETATGRDSVGFGTPLASGHSEEWSSPLLDLDFEDGLHWSSGAVGTYTLDPRHSATSLLVTTYFTHLAVLAMRQRRRCMT